jgi:hypothetical protein
MALSGLWGSVFSRQGGRALARPWNARPFRKIAIAVGAPIPAAAAQPDSLRTEILRLRGETR